MEQKKKKSFLQELTVLKDHRVQAYTFIQLAYYIGGLFATNYAVSYMTNTAGVPAALSATFVMITNILAFVIGICGGPLLQSINPSGGKKDRLYSWLMLSGFVFMIAEIIVFFNNSIFGNAGVYITGIFYIIMQVAGALLLSVTYTVMGALAGSDVDLRNLMGIWGLRGNKVGNLALDAMTAPLIGVFASLLGVKWSYTPLGIVYALIYYIAVIIFGQVYNKEVIEKGIEFEEQTNSAKAFFKSFATIIQNKRYLFMLMIDAIHYICTAILGTGAIYFWMLFGKFESTYASAMTILNTLTWVFLIFCPAIGRKMGKRNAKAFALAFMAITMVIAYFIGPKTPWIHVIVMTVYQFGYMSWGGFAVPLALDEAERFYYEKKIDMRSVVPSMLSIAPRLGYMIGSAIFTYALAYIGLDNIDFTNLSTVTDKFMGDFMFVWMGLAAIAEVVAALLWNFGYKMTEKQANYYAAENLKEAATVKE